MSCVSADMCELILNWKSQGWGDVSWWARAWRRAGEDVTASIGHAPNPERIGAADGS